MNNVLSKAEHRHVAHEHRGDLYRDVEEATDTAARVRAHLRAVIPDMETKVRLRRGSGFTGLTVSIVRHGEADLSDRDTGFASRQLVNAQLGRFIRYDWEPNHGMRRVSLSTNSHIDPTAHASAADGAPDIESRVSFAEFTRTARPGDVLEHVAGEVPHRGPRVIVTAVSSRRLTTRASEDLDARPSRKPIQGGACFACDGDLIFFRHSGFTSAGGYSVMRWTRQG